MRAADRSDPPLLQGAQGADLRRLGQVSHLVEEEGPALGGAEQALLALRRAGEGARFVSEELGFDQGLGHGAAVERDEAACAG